MARQRNPFTDPFTTFNKMAPSEGDGSYEDPKGPYDPNPGGTTEPPPEVAPGQPKDPKVVPDPPPAKAANPYDWSTLDLNNRDAVHGYVQNYYDSRHVNPYDTSVDYWTNKIMGAKGRGEDPAYYGVQRLAQADEFTGKPANYDWVGAQNATSMGIPQMPQMPSGGGGGGGGIPSSGGSGKGFTTDSLKEALASLFPGGAFNQDIVNRRVSSANDALVRQRASQKATDQAYLAERGLMQSGPEAMALNKLNENTDASYQDAVSNIYSNESQAADARMMQALQMATGMSESEAQQAIDAFRAQTESRSVDNQYALGQGQLGLGYGQLGLGYYNANNDFTLGQGRLAIDNMNGVNNYNLGLGNLGLGRDTLQWNMQSGGLDRLLEIIKTLQGGAQTSQNGYT